MIPSYIKDDFTICNLFKIGGDKFLLGPDLRTRFIDGKVETEEGQLYKFFVKNAQPFILGENNMLSLRHRKTKEIINIKVGDFAKSTLYFKSECEFYGLLDDADVMQEKIVPIHPYLLGLWLGKGSKTDPIIETNTAEIIAWLKEYSENKQFTVIQQKYKQKPACFMYDRESQDEITAKHFMSLFVINNNLINEKHIPIIYKSNSNRIKLELLAGLIDSSGTNIDDTYYSLRVKTEKVRDDCIFLIKSLGFNVTSCKQPTPKSSHCIQFHGRRLSDIPCKVESKRIRNLKRKESMFFYIKQIVKDKIGVYDSICILGKDGRYMTSDFITMMRDREPQTVLDPADDMRSIEEPVIITIDSDDDKTYEDYDEKRGKRFRDDEISSPPSPPISSYSGNPMVPCPPLHWYDSKHESLLRKQSSLIRRGIIEVPKYDATCMRHWDMPSLPPLEDPYHYTPRPPEL